MNVPDEVRDNLKAKLWTIADAIDWLALSANEKTQHYENWANDPEIAGILSRFMDVRQLRVYIKDTLLKKYPEMRESDATRPFQLLGIPQDTPIAKSFTRPHGRELCDGRVISWGRASKWKAVVMSVHERAFQGKAARPFAAVLLHAAGKFSADCSRAVVSDAANKLGIERLVWH